VRCNRRRKTIAPPPSEKSATRRRISRIILSSVVNASNRPRPGLLYALSRHASRKLCVFIGRVDRSNIPRYELVTKKLNWQSAAEYCRDRNSQLVAIANKKEQYALRLYLVNRQVQGQQRTSGINPAFLYRATLC